MEEKSQKATFLVTAVFLTLLLIFGAFLKPQEKGNTADAEKTAEAPVDLKRSVTLPRMVTELPAGGAPEPVHYVPMRNQDEVMALPNCTLMQDKWNDGDTFLVHTKLGNYRFTLLYADCPDTYGTSSRITGGHFQYFRIMEESRIRKVATSARDFSLAHLQGRRFDVVTRFEEAQDENPVEGGKTYYAFIYVKNAEAQNENLAEKLVENGLARIRANSEELPDLTTSREFIHHLELLQSTARQDLKGAWRWSEPGA